MGTSASLFDDDTMLIGSPGPYTWRGVIFVTSFLEDYLKRDKTMYYSKHEEEVRGKINDEKLKKYSYLGIDLCFIKIFRTTCVISENRNGCYWWTLFQW